jgi:hypothetical protein
MPYIQCVKNEVMSSSELKQLEKCMGHLAYILDRLGVKEAKFAEGQAEISMNEQPLNTELMDNLCHHVSALYRDELVSDEEALDPDFYFEQ